MQRDISILKHFESHVFQALDVFTRQLQGDISALWEVVAPKIQMGTLSTPHSFSGS